MPSNTFLVTMIACNIIFSIFGLILKKNPEILKTWVSTAIDCWSSGDWKERARNRIRKRKFKSESGKKKKTVYTDFQDNGFSVALVGDKLCIKGI